MEKKLTKQALDYHSSGKPGKIEVVPTKPYSTQHDLSLAYTPGVAIPCKRIEANQDDAYKYTSKGNLVAVISNGTAVLGLGDIGALAGKPVMEGKGLLFKIFGDVDVFDIEVDEKDTEKLINVIKAIAPTFGGINLEDIKAPECFEIEKRLKEELDIPVFHDDQHGTAIISAAGLLNALVINGKKIEDIKILINGAGAAAISCARLYEKLGVKHDNMLMFDSRGPIKNSRTDLNETKKEFAIETDVETLADGFEGVDVFLGLSVGNCVTGEMVKRMAKDPIVFACSNPDPEIPYEEAIKAREDIIMATGRSDYPNQINNVLGFPFIFRGALDVRATDITEEMKLAAAYALADLAREPVPDCVTKAYDITSIAFGRNYIIPKPVDPRLIANVSAAVAKAAMESGVAKQPITDWDAYIAQLNSRIGQDNILMRMITNQAVNNPKRVVYTHANDVNVLKAAQIAVQEKYAYPILLGRRTSIENLAKLNGVDLTGIEIIECGDDKITDKANEYAKLLYDKLKRRGMTYDEAHEEIYDKYHYSLMMLESGDADCVVSEHQSRTKSIVNSAIDIVGTKTGALAAFYIMLTKKGNLFLANAPNETIIPSDVIAKVALLMQDKMKKYKIKPVMALISHSTFGQENEGSASRARAAVKYLHENNPEVIVDGEIQINMALDKELRQKKYPFSKLKDEDVNVFILPNMTSGTVAFQLMQEFGSSQAIGPVITGFKKPVHSVKIGASVTDIVNITKIAVTDAQELDC